MCTEAAARHTVQHGVEIQPPRRIDAYVHDRRPACPRPLARQLEGRRCGEKARIPRRERGDGRLQHFARAASERDVVGRHVEVCCNRVRRVAHGEEGVSVRLRQRIAKGRDGGRARTVHILVAADPDDLRGEWGCGRRGVRRLDGSAARGCSSAACGTRAAGYREPAGSEGAQE